MALQSRSPASPDGYLVAVAAGLMAGFWLLAYVGVVPGSWAWAFLRLTGVMGYALLTLSVAAGALLSSRYVPRWFGKPLQFGWHGLTAGSGLVLVAIHAAMMLLDTSEPNPLAAILVPGMAATAPGAIALGTLASYLMLAPYVTMALRKRLPRRWVRLLHLLAYPSFLLATLHGVLAGSDRLGWLYLPALALVAFTFSIRLLEHRRTQPKPS